MMITTRFPLIAYHLDEESECSDSRRIHAIRLLADSGLMKDPTVIRAMGRLEQAFFIDMNRQGGALDLCLAAERAVIDAWTDGSHN